MRVWDCVSVKRHGRGAVFAIPADSRQEYQLVERETARAQLGRYRVSHTDSVELTSLDPLQKAHPEVALIRVCVEPTRRASTTSKQAWHLIEKRDILVHSAAIVQPTDTEYTPRWFESSMP